MVLRRAATECPKKVAGLVDLVNLPTQLREFAGGRSQMSHISFFLRVWSYIKENKLQDLTARSSELIYTDLGQNVDMGNMKFGANGKTSEWQLMLPTYCQHIDPTNKNIVKCDEKLKTVLLGRSKVELSELPMIVKLHFPKFPR